MNENRILYHKEDDCCIKHMCYTCIYRSKELNEYPCYECCQLNDDNKFCYFESESAVIE